MCKPDTRYATNEHINIVQRIACHVGEGTTFMSRFKLYLASLQLCTHGRVCLQHRGVEGEGEASRDKSTE